LPVAQPADFIECRVSSDSARFRSVMSLADPADASS
jgi:hypothetical protein